MESAFVSGPPQEPQKNGAQPTLPSSESKSWDFKQASQNSLYIAVFRAHKNTNVYEIRPHRCVGAGRARGAFAYELATSAKTSNLI